MPNDLGALQIMYKIIVMGKVYAEGFNSMQSALDYADSNFKALDFRIEGH